jgi:predicted adenylyl cyclase CyaB
MLEQEVKLPFANVEVARRSVEGTGARLVVSRRLLDDRLFDTEDQQLHRAGCALRVRRDGPGACFTFKGPAQPGPVKSREEIETEVGDAAIAEALLRALGFRRWFRAEKYREDYALGSAVVTVDEVPCGVFVEIEAAPAEIDRIAGLLGRSRADYVLLSYRALYAQWCEGRGITPGDMVFQG